ncbi:hypothetical protein RHSIM_Rhsim09G0041600 [Rhododendron simsii]|uniref:Exocyst subunit Exo70 family protein n=1 Tax=Rhododendron simsii TaxID=118357 RepID=A0A834GEB4_RHOSS|nr:hypothetical protein RHSIM_Rhsim09G0041600 [Rhododendron simsii]
MGCCNLIGFVLSMMAVGGPLSLISTPLLKGFCIPGRGSGCFSMCSASSAAKAGRVAVSRGDRHTKRRFISDFRTCLEDIDVEAVTFLDALCWACGKGFSKLEVLTDCLVLVQALRSMEHADVFVKPVIRNILDLVQEFDYVAIANVPRNIERIAHNLARSFIVEKVRVSNLKYLLGDDWITKHEKKVRQYAANYEVTAWSKVFSTLPENSSDGMSPEMVKTHFRQFNLGFEQVYRKQTSWVVLDGKLRDEIKVSIAKNLVPAYREFYDTHLVALSGEKNLEVLVRFAPENLGNYLSDLFHGTAVSGSSSSSMSSSSLSRVSQCLS